MSEDRAPAAVAQLVERVLGKDEVTGPTPVSSSGRDRVRCVFGAWVCLARFVV